MTNTVHLPFEFQIGGKGKVPTKKSIFDRIFSSHVKDEENTDSSDGEQKMLFSGSVDSTTTCEVSVEELKELFAENKEALKDLAEGKYSKAFYEAGKCIADAIKGIADSVTEYLPTFEKKFNHSMDAVYSMQAHIDELGEAAIAKETAKEANKLTNEVVLEGMRNEIKNDIKRGYTFMQREMEGIVSGEIEKPEYSKEYAELYLKLLKEILEDLSKDTE